MEISEWNFRQNAELQIEKSCVNRPRTLITVLCTPLDKDLLNTCSWPGSRHPCYTLLYPASKIPQDDVEAVRCDAPCTELPSYQPLSPRAEVSARAQTARAADEVISYKLSIFRVVAGSQYECRSEQAYEVFWVYSSIVMALRGPRTSQPEANQLTTSTLIIDGYACVHPYRGDVDAIWRRNGASAG